jgi:hypothetical protein
MRRDELVAASVADTVHEIETTTQPVHPLSARRAPSTLQRLKPSEARKRLLRSFAPVPPLMDQGGESEGDASEGQPKKVHFYHIEGLPISFSEI